MTITTLTPTVLCINNASVSSGSNTILAGVAGKSIYLIGYNITTTTPLTIQSSDASVVVTTIDQTAGGTCFSQLPSGIGLVAIATGSGTASGHFLGFVN